MIDPDKVTSRSKVSKTIKSNLFNVLIADLLDKYSDLLKDYFTDESMQDLKSKFNPSNDEIEDKQNANNKVPDSDIEYPHEDIENMEKNEKTDNNNNNNTDNQRMENNNPELISTNSDNPLIIGNSTSHGEDAKAYELNETSGNSVAKQANWDMKYFIAIAIVLILVAIGYKRNRRLE